MATFMHRRYLENLLRNILWQIQSYAWIITIVRIPSYRTNGIKQPQEPDFTGWFAMLLSPLQPLLDCLLYSLIIVSDTIGKVACCRCSPAEPKDIELNFFNGE
ncbi:hypothetical protein BN135_3264 [Cronobacter muytjensii 530]